MKLIKNNGVVVISDERVINPYPADPDNCRFKSVLLVNQNLVIVIGNEMCV